MKRRHWCFLADVSSGKTTYFEKLFQGKAVYKRPPGAKYYFEHGAYHGEPIIIYDDLWPKFDELVAVSNVYFGRQQVYGESRYHANYWPVKQQRVIIMLLNKENCPSYISNPADKHHQLFLARFNLRKWPERAVAPGQAFDLTDEERELLDEVQKASASVAN